MPNDGYLVKLSVEEYQNLYEYQRRRGYGRRPSADEPASTDGGSHETEDAGEETDSTATSEPAAESNGDNPSGAEPSNSDSDSKGAAPPTVGEYQDAQLQRAVEALRNGTADASVRHERQ